MPSSDSALAESVGPDSSRPEDGRSIQTPLFKRSGLNLCRNLLGCKGGSGGINLSLGFVPQLIGSFGPAAGTRLVCDSRHLRL